MYGSRHCANLILLGGTADQPTGGLGTLSGQHRYAAMVNFAIDPELRIRGFPEIVLRQSDEALTFLRKKSLIFPRGHYQDILRIFEAIRDEWSALEAVVRLEILLEAEGLLIDHKRSAPPSQANAVKLKAVSGEDQVTESRAAP